MREWTTRGDAEVCSPGRQEAAASRSNGSHRGLNRSSHGTADAGRRLLPLAFDLGAQRVAGTSHHVRGNEDDDDRRDRGELFLGHAVLQRSS